MIPRILEKQMEFEQKVGKMPTHLYVSGAEFLQLPENIHYFNGNFYILGMQVVVGSLPYGQKEFFVTA